MSISDAPATEHRSAPVRQQTVRLVPAPPGMTYDDVVWLEQRSRLIVTGRTGQEPWASHLYALRLDGSDLYRLPVPPQRGCRHTSQAAPARLDGATFAYLQTCWGSVRSVEPSVSLRVYDSRTGKSAPLVSYALPFQTGAFSFASQRRFGVVSDTTSRQLMWVGRRRLIPLKLPLTDASLPSWDPTSKQLALRGVPAADSSGPSYTRPPSLYLRRRTNGQLRLLLPRLNGLGQAAWAPDGRRIAVPMQPRRKAAGLWLVNVSTSQTRLVVAGTELGGVTWLPDGRTLVAAVGILSPIDSKPSRSRDVGLYVIRLVK